jgi:hypothetical protein
MPSYQHGTCTLQTPLHHVAKTSKEAAVSEKVTPLDRVAADRTAYMAGAAIDIVECGTVSAATGGAEEREG